MGPLGWWKTLLQREFQPPAPNRCWAGDITTIRTSAVWRNLAVWIDLYNRRVVVWKLDQRMDAALVIEALNRTLGHRRVKPEKLLIHMDQGNQDRALRLPEPARQARDRLQHVRRGLLLGQRRGGELFLQPHTGIGPLTSPQQLQRDLAFWIEGYYNRERRHSAIGDLSPIDDELLTTAARTLTPAEP